VANESDQKGAPPRPPSGTQPRVTGPRASQRPSETMAKASTQYDSEPPPSRSQPPVKLPSREMAAAAEPAPVASDGDAYIGTTVAGRYKILRKLGEGGMGVVYLAEHVFIEKKVAIKILSDDMSRKADLVARFMQEAKAASKIGHENIIDITDFGETASGGVFFVMEFLDGADLSHAIRDGGPMAIDRTRYIFNQICRALGAAHSKGIIHRDMKPENIYLVTREGRADWVKVLDFGIAKISSLDEGGSRLTRTGMIFGTPEYMSPEQARGDKPDHRVDVYAAGCILYEMLTGDVPFHAETFMGVLTKHMFEQPQPPSQRAPHQSISAELEAVVLKALAKDRDQRYQTMKDLALAFEGAVGGDATLAWGNEGSGVIPMPKGDTSNLVKLGGATAQKMPSASLTGAPIADEPKKSKTGLIAGLLVVGLLGGGAAVVALKKKAPEPPPVAPPVVEKVEPKAVQPPKPVEPTKPAAPVASKIQLESTPSGAEVFSGAEKLGLTPTTLEYPPDTAPFEVSLRKKGYREQKLRVSPDRSRDYVVELAVEQRKEKPASSRPAARPAAAPVEAKQPEAKPEVKPAGKLRDLKDPFAN
jgi:serine/threonine-protein kinase